MKFSEKLQKLRKEKGYSQEQLADLLEVSRQSVSKWESGTTYPEMDKLLMLCKIFNVTLDDLTNDEITDKAIKEKSKGTLNNFIYAILDMINKSVEMFKNMSKKDLMKCVTEMLIVVVILLVFNLPFQYINDLAREIFMNFGPKAYSIIYSIWNFFTSIIYLVLFIAVLVYVYKTRYLDKFDFQKTNVEEVKESKNDAEEKDTRVSEKREEKHSYILFDVLGSVFNFLVKLCLIFFSIPVICVFFAFIFLTVAAVILFIKGITYPGVIIGLLGCVLLAGLVMEIVIRFLVNAEFKFKRLFWIFVSGLVICGIGVGVATFEVAETEFVNEVPQSEKLVTKNFEFAMNDKLYLDPDHGYYYHYYRDTNYKVDEALTDKVLVTVDYYEDYLSINADINNNEIYVTSWEAPYVFKHTYNLLLDNLRNKTLYNYSELSQINITVTSSSSNIEKLKQNYENYLKEEQTRYEEEQYWIYYNEINELTTQNDKLQMKLDEANETINELEEKIDEIENLIK